MVMYLCVNVTDGFRPLMLNTQRLSSLAFNLRDGRIKDPSRLTAQMKQLAVRYKQAAVCYTCIEYCALWQHFHGSVEERIFCSMNIVLFCYSCNFG